MPLIISHLLTTLASAPGPNETGAIMPNNLRRRASLIILYYKEKF
jgi:hypothetical protein